MLRYIKVLCASLFACCCVNVATAQTPISGTWAGGELTGSYKLTGNTTLKGTISVKTGTLTIDLNGYTLNRNGSKAADFIFTVGEARTLNIIDSSAGKTGKITGGRGDRGGCALISGILNFSGGEITNCIATDGNYGDAPTTDTNADNQHYVTQGCGGAFFVNSGATLKMSGNAKITNCNTEKRDGSHGRGGAVFVAGTFEMSGGTIEGCSASLGGAVFVFHGAMNPYYNKDTRSGTFNMTGGKISKCRSYGRGCAIHTQSKVDISGSAEISDNRPIDWPDVTLLDGKYPKSQTTTSCYGGALYADGENAIVSMSGGTMKSNQALSGGAVMLWGHSTFTMTGGTIDGNYALGTGGLGNGGAVYVQTSTFNFYGGTLSNNRANRYGGAVNLNQTATLVIGRDNTPCVVSGNRAAHGGGISQEAGECSMTLGASGIDINGNEAHGHQVDANGNILANDGNGGGLFIEKGTITITAGTIRNNIASGHGGGAVLYVNRIYGAITEAYISGGTITGNSAKYGGGLDLYGGYKGLEDGDKSSLVVKYLNGTLSNNTASVNGAGIYVSFDEAYTTATMTIGTNTTTPSVNGNIATGNGGAFGMANTGEIIVKNINASGNKATNGGAIWQSKGTFHIENGTFQSNEATSANGGAICLDNGTFTIKNGTFTGNVAKGNGGAICLNAGSFTTQQGGTITIGSNSNGNAAASGYGGGIYCNAPFTANGVVELGYNSAMSGGAIYVAGGNFVINGESTISNNSATGTGDNVGMGGALYVQNGSVTLAKNTISGNSATKNGGAIFVTGGGSGFTATGASEITNNTAGWNGGALYLGSGNVSLKASTITGNSTTGTGDNGKGGAIYLNGGLTLGGDATISENAASGSGGAVYVQGGSITQSSGKITSSGNNSTGGDGGVFYVNGGSITLLENTMSSNSAKNGGVFYVNTGNISLGASNITGNEAKGDDGKGGAIYLNGDLTLGGTSTLSSNKAVGSGGAIYVQGGSITQSSGTMTSNQNQSTSGDGGVFYVNGGSINLGKTTMEQNSATNGGAIALFNGSFGFGNQSNISHNTASGNGGGLYVVNSSNTQRTISCDGGSLTANTAGGNGGGLYVDGKINFSFASSLTADITDNTAANGGGIYIDGGANMTFGNGLIVRNAAGTYATESTAATGRGGGIYLGGGTLSFGSISSLGIYGNSAGLEAADIYSSGSSTTLNLPNVSGMNLTGFDVPGSTLYWVKDFSDDNEEYLGRYESALLNLNINIEEMILGFANGQATQAITNEMCLDLGYDLVYVGLEAKNLVLYGMAEKSVVKMYYKRGNDMNLYRTAVINGVTSGDNLVTKVGLPTGQWYFEIDDFSETHDVTVTFANDTNILGANNITSAVELNRKTIQPSGVTTPYNVVFSFTEKTWADSDTPGNPPRKPLNATASVVNKMKW